MRLPARKANHSNRTSDHTKTRERIIEAAARGFSSRGFAGASIRGIADDAKVTHQLIAYYYGGKEDLWWAVVELEIDRLLDAYSDKDAKTKDASPTERFQELVEAFVEYEAKSGTLARLMLQEALANSTRYQKLLSHRKLAGAFPITRFIDEAHEAGILIDQPLEEIKLNFLSLISHRYITDLYASLTLGKPVRSKAAIQDHAKNIAEMFLQSASRRP